jgi:hypothetical protein
VKISIFLRKTLLNIRRTIIEKHIKKYLTLINVKGPKLRKYAIIGLISVAPRSIKNKVSNASIIFRKRMDMMATKSVELY